MENQSWLSSICIPKAKEDSGWKVSSTSKPHRGIHDYYRDIEFEHEPSKHDVQLLCQILAKDPKCPGWTGVSAVHKYQTAYRFYTTWDSSD